MSVFLCSQGSDAPYLGVSQVAGLSGTVLIELVDLSDAVDDGAAPYTVDLPWVQQQQQHNNQQDHQPHQPPPDQSNSYQHPPPPQQQYYPGPSSQVYESALPPLSSQRAPSHYQQPIHPNGASQHGPYPSSFHSYGLSGPGPPMGYKQDSQTPRESICSRSLNDPRAHTPPPSLAVWPVLSI